MALPSVKEQAPWPAIGSLPYQTFQHKSLLTAFLPFITPHSPSVPSALAESSVAHPISSMVVLTDGSHPCGDLSLKRSTSPSWRHWIITDTTNAST